MPPDVVGQTEQDNSKKSHAYHEHHQGRPTGSKPPQVLIWRQVSHLHHLKWELMRKRSQGILTNKRRCGVHDFPLQWYLGGNWSVHLYGNTNTVRKCHLPHKDPIDLVSCMDHTKHQLVPTLGLRSLVLTAFKSAPILKLLPWKQNRLLST